MSLTAMQTCVIVLQGNSPQWKFAFCGKHVAVAVSGQVAKSRKTTCCSQARCRFPNSSSDDILLTAHNSPAGVETDENLNSSNTVADVQLASPAQTAASKWKVKTEAASAGPTKTTQGGKAKADKKAAAQQPRRSSRSQAAGKRTAS